MSYQPRPLDTSAIRLAPGLADLTELLARNIHENWAALRVREGWRHGPRRDDAKKEHPCLVPYDQLPESEKNYDRTTALETLGTIQVLGFRIERVHSVESEKE